jgi:nitronate monooxygenase
VAKGGAEEATVGRKCLCNALLANIGHAQVRVGEGALEPPLVTLGDDINTVARFLPPGQHTYTASDVVANILALQPA